MKKQYLTPAATLLALSDEDVIRTSGILSKVLYDDEGYGDEVQW